MVWLVILGSLLGIAWVGSVAYLALEQRRFIFRPTLRETDPVKAGAEWMSAIHDDHGQLLGWWFPPPNPTAPTLVFFHGNQGYLARVAEKTATWRNLGIGVFATAFHGFDGSPGQPTESSMYEDGRTALDWLALHGAPTSSIILYGESLGSGVAMQMAVERPIRAVILEAAFSSVAKAATDRYPWVPADLLIRDRFDNLAKIGSLSVPLLILHGDRDETTALSHSLRLAEAAPPDFTEMAIIHGAGHLDLYENGAYERLSAFLIRNGAHQGSLKPLIKEREESPHN